MGFCGIVPAFHTLVLLSKANTVLMGISLMATFFIISVGFYVTGFPESCYPVLLRHPFYPAPKFGTLGASCSCGGVTALV